jgi:1-deoxy-D-xylulose-5-phosphate synthase
LPDEVIEHGEQHQLHAACGIDPEGIEHSVMELLVSEPLS